MKAYLNRIKTALLLKVLAVLSWLSIRIRAKVAVDYAIRGPIAANRGRSVPRPPMVFVTRNFSRRNVPQKIEFDGDADGDLRIRD